MTSGLSTVGFFVTVDPQSIAEYIGSFIPMCEHLTLFVGEAQYLGGTSTVQNVQIDQGFFNRSNNFLFHKKINNFLSHQQSGTGCCEILNLEHC